MLSANFYSLCKEVQSMGGAIQNVHHNIIVPNTSNQGGKSIKKNYKLVKRMLINVNMLFNAGFNCIDFCFF